MGRECVAKLCTIRYFSAFFYALIWFSRTPAMGAAKFLKTFGPPPRSLISQHIVSLHVLIKISIVPRQQKSGVPFRSRRVAHLGSLLNHLCTMSAFAA